jgi:hypothetical protein
MGVDVVLCMGFCSLFLNGCNIEDFSLMLDNDTAHHSMKTRFFREEERKRCPCHSPCEK